jgi:D-alanyl-lipoteichoic acid acyltransferase DltB (MBOAT superfamily)
MPIRGLDFWFPTTTIGLSLTAWVITRSKNSSFSLQDRWAAIAAMMVVLFAALLRFTPISLTSSRPPQVWQAILAIALFGVIAWAYNRFLRETTWALKAGFWRLVILLVILKFTPLSLWSSMLFRDLAGQDPNLATGFDIRWLGISYITFRWMHTFLDQLAGRLPEVGLKEYLSFILFAPALTAGPIDRIERFIKDLRAEFLLSGEQLVKAGERLATGLFMKFILADSIALFALNSQIASQTYQSGWMWLLLYAYTLRIFFDFAGYTHIAIGIGMLAGIQLPENFRRPYLQADLTQFWNNWHMTLAQWFRAYFFNPLSRNLRQRKWAVWAIILVGQLGTMVLIGLWHGITINFLIWGLWHGLGLFVHNRWADFSKGRFEILNSRWAMISSGFLTFNFVTLGWVWFALPEFDQALHVFRVLFGGGA